MDGVKQVEPPGYPPAPAPLFSAVKADWGHGRHGEQLDGDALAEKINGYAVHPQADHRQAQRLSKTCPLCPSGQTEQGDQQDARPAVAGVQQLRGQCEEQQKRQLPERLFRLPHAPQQHRPQQQGPQDILVSPGIHAAVEHEIIHALRQQRHAPQPEKIPPGIPGMCHALCQQKAVNWKGQPPNRPEP